VWELEREALPHRRFPHAEVRRRWGPTADSLFYFTHYHVYQQLTTIEGVAILAGFLHEETSFPLAANFRIDPFTDRVHGALKFRRSAFTDERMDEVVDAYDRAIEDVMRSSRRPLVREVAL
jgi:hypothetical protein